MYGEYNLSAYDYVLIMLVVAIPVVVLLVSCYREAKADAQVPPMTKAQYDAWVLATYPECNNAFPMYMEDERMEGIYPMEDMVDALKPVHYDGVWPGEGLCGCKDCVDAWYENLAAVNYTEKAQADVDLNRLREEFAGLKSISVDEFCWGDHPADEECKCEPF